MSRDGHPRDEPLDDSNSSELIDLGESPLPSRLDVPPASVRSLGRRLDPRLAPVLAVSIVIVALLGTGPLAPHPTPTSSASQPVGLASITPEPTEDPCPPETAKPPKIALSVGRQAPVRLDVAGLGSTPEEPAVVVPVEHPLQARGGEWMHLDVVHTNCIELVGIDLIDTARPTGDALKVRVAAPLDEGSRTVNWNAPPAGDWVVRVALRLRAPLAEGASGPWAVYFFRMNSGYVAWASPLPVGADGGIAEGPLVTPAVPCGPAPDGPEPPVVELLAADTAVPGVLGDHQWHGSEVAGGGVPDALLGVTPIDMPVPHTLLIAGSACATSWSISAGGMPSAGEPFGWGWAIDRSPENALQNTFDFPTDVYGTYVIEASFTFLSGDHETVYWYVHADLPWLPEVQMLAAPSGDAVTLAVGGCGAWQSARAQAAPLFELGGRLGTEICGSSGSQTPDLPTLTVAAETKLQLDANGLAITNWSVTHVDREDLDPLPCWAPLVSGSSSYGVASLEIPTLPPGDWTLQVSLTLTDGADSSGVPYLVHLVVLGPETPSPSCEPYDVG